MRWGLALALWLVASVATATTVFEPGDGSGAGLLVAYVTVDVDPTAVGTTTVGLREALAQCNGGAGSCVMRLRPGTHYTLPARSTWGSQNLLRINATHVVIDGTGAFLDWTDNAGTNTTLFFDVPAGASDIEFRNLHFTGHETCTHSCNKTGAIINIESTAENVRIVAPELTMTEAATDDTTYGCYRAIWTQADKTTNPDSEPENVKIDGGTISHSCRGVEIQAGNYVHVRKVHFDMHGHPDAVETGAGFHVLKYTGVGDDVIGTSMDMALDDYNTVPSFTGIGMSHNFSLTTAADMNEGLTVMGNQIFGLRAGMGCMDWSGYNAAVVVGNHCSAGVCSADTKRSCYKAEKCSDIGGTCDPSNVVGFSFTDDAVDNNSYNRDSTVAENNFDGFQNNGVAACPIFIQGITGTDPLANADNVFKNNHARLGDATKDLFCGDLVVAERNHISENTVQGSVNPAVDTDTIRQVCGTIPVQGTTLQIFKVPANVKGRVVRFWCAASGTVGTAATYHLTECDTAGANCSRNTTSALSCAGSGGNSTTTFGGSAGSDWAAGEIIELESTNTGTSTATAWCFDWKMRP